MSDQHLVNSIIASAILRRSQGSASKVGMDPEEAKQVAKCIVEALSGAGLRIDRSEKFAGLLPLALVAPEPRQAHRGAQFPGLCLLLRARPRARARNTLPLSPHPAPATSARFRRQCDGPRPRTTFPWLFPPPSSLRQCSAKRHRIGRVPHRRCAKYDKYNGIHTVAPVDRHAVIPEVIMWTASEALPVRANSATLVHHSARLPEQGAFFVRQSDKLIELARLLPRNFRRGYG